MTTEKLIDRTLKHYPRILLPDYCGIIAIDGRCASGKTTFGKVLSEKTGIPCIPLDDFFLRVEQRTPKRFAEPGGNVDRERILEEVLIPFRKGEFSGYRPFSCKTFTLQDKREMPRTNALILEGSYAFHPELYPYYDLRIFLDIDPEIQKKRLQNRETPESYQRFLDRWIPLEEKYFETFDPKEKADLYFITGFDTR